ARSWPLTSDSTSCRSPSKRPSRPIWPNATARSAPPPRSATRSRLDWAENGRGHLGEHSQGPSRAHVRPTRAKTVTVASARVIRWVALKLSEDGPSPAENPRLQGRRDDHTSATGAGVMNCSDSVTQHKEK